MGESAARRLTSGSADPRAGFGRVTAPWAVMPATTAGPSPWLAAVPRSDGYRDVRAVVSCVSPPEMESPRPFRGAHHGAAARNSRQPSRLDGALELPQPVVLHAFVHEMISMMRIAMISFVVSVISVVVFVLLFFATGHKETCQQQQTGKNKNRNSFHKSALTGNGSFLFCFPSTHESLPEHTKTSGDARQQRIAQSTTGLSPIVGGGEEQRGV